MISKIIQKEKERQDKIIREHTAFMGDCPEDPKPFQYNNPSKETHKQSLINLKEYIEQYMEFAYPEALERAKEDIEELTKMIEAYK